MLPLLSKISKLFKKRDMQAENAAFITQYGLDPEQQWNDAYYDVLLQTFKLEKKSLLQAQEDFEKNLALANFLGDAPDMTTECFTTMQKYLDIASRITDRQFCIQKMRGSGDTIYSYVIAITMPEPV